MSAIAIAIQQLQETSQSVMIATLSPACDCTIIEKFAIELDSNYEFTNATCLAIAVLRDDPAAVETSLEKGCHVNYGQIDCKIIQSMPVPDENEGSVEYMLTPLIMACRWSSLPVVALLIGHPGTQIDRKNGQGDSALCWAVRKSGNLDMARLLVQAGANVRSRDGEGYSCLYRAVEAGTLDIVKYLHSKGASLTTHAGNPAWPIYTPLYKAVSGGNHPMVRYLAENGATLVLRHFHVAVRTGNVEIVKYMIEQGVDVTAKNDSGQSPIKSAQDCMENEEEKKNYEEIITMVQAAEADFKHDEVIKLCDCSIMEEEFEIQSEMPSRNAFEMPANRTVIVQTLSFKNLSCLSIAVLQDDTKAVKTSLKKGCHVNFDKNEVYIEGCSSGYRTGFTPLMLACMHSSLPVVSLLLQQPGIELDKVNEAGCYYAALSWAVRRKDNLDMVKLMVEAGADPDMRDLDGYSHLHTAVERDSNGLREAYGQVDIVQYLHSQGADVNTKHTSERGTPLWAAATRGDLAMVKYLATHGAFLRERNTYKGGYDYHLTAAIEAGHVDIVSFLFQQGADVNLKSGWESNLEIAQRSLLAAVAGGYVEVVRFLIQQGVDVNWESGENNYLDFAQRCYEARKQDVKYQEIISMLKEAGAKEPDNKPED